MKSSKHPVVHQQEQVQDARALRPSTSAVTLKRGAGTAARLVCERMLLVFFYCQGIPTSSRLALAKWALQRTRTLSSSIAPIFKLTLAVAPALACATANTQICEKLLEKTWTGSAARSNRFAWCRIEGAGHSRGQTFERRAPRHERGFYIAGTLRAVVTCSPELVRD